MVMNYRSCELYKTTSSGSLRQWRVWSEGSNVFTEHGQVGGKLQISMDTVKGKNRGRSNETTSQEQAALDAEHLKDAYVKKGYSETRAAAEKTTNALPGALPMLAHVYEDLKDPVYPAFVQPKLDGVRCLAVVKDGKCLLYTRSQKIIDTVPHINAAVEKVADLCGIDSFVFDGELYNSEFSDDFGRILGAIKRKESIEDSHLVHYHVYDMVSDDPFSIRTDALAHMLKGRSLPLVRVDTQMVVSEEAMYEYARNRVAAGFEGAMFRSTSGLYEGKRSKHLCKVKTMKDGEFEVIGTQEGRGKLMGKVGAWVCKMKSGVEFKAKMEGKLDDLPAFGSKVANNSVGKMLTVRYQGLTPDGVPRFPVGVRFKDAVEV